MSPPSLVCVLLCYHKQAFSKQRHTIVDVAHVNLTQPLVPKMLLRKKSLWKRIGQPNRTVVVC